MSLQALWIWDGGDPAPRNAVVNFRRTFSLQDVPAHATLHISADCRYVLYVNSVRLGYGPARAYQFRYEYDTYAVAADLRAGANVLAVSVLHWGEDTFHHLAARGGLLAQLEDAPDGAIRVMSDSTWRVRRSAAYRRDTPRIACQLPWEEQFDARAEETGWTEAGFDDSAWNAAVEIGPVGMAPWTGLAPRTIPFLTDEPLAPVRCTALGTVQRPAVVVAAHLTPYVTPGAVHANQRTIDLLLATVLQAPRAGDVTLRRSALYGDPPHVLLDAEEIRWQPDGLGVTATRHLAAGAHLLLLDWAGRVHDLDMTVAAAGLPGMTVASPLPDDAGIWALALDPGAARAAVRAATDATTLRDCGASWRPISAMDTPGADITMDIVAGLPVHPAEQPVALPIVIPAPPADQAAHYLIDFGRMVIGWIALDVEAPAGAVLDLLGFEGMQEGRRVLPEQMNNSLRYVCRAGRQQYTSLVRRGFRYLLVAVHGAGEDVTLHHLIAHLATYPGPRRGAFRCADTRLNQIWELAVYTLQLCTEDTFTDCPTYEQTLWVGDARTEALVHAAVHGDPRIVDRCLRLVADSLQRTPIANSQVPSGWEDALLPNWSWLWAIACREHYQYSGDLAFVREIYPALARQAAFIETARQASAHGLFEMPGAWHFLDWTALDTPPDAIVAHENCLAVAALRATAELAETLGAGADAARWRAGALAIAAAINRVFWSEEEQAYMDSLHADGTLSCVVSQPTNVCALFAEVAGEARAAALAPYVIARPAHWIGTGSPFMLGFNCEVLARQGRASELLQVIRDRWGDMLDRGATTAWEMFSGYMPQGLWTRSWCHAWSAMPAYLLSAFVLGVRPLEPGFARALVAPQLGDLAWAAGRVPTPRGDIAVEVERRRRGLVLTLRLPAGVAAEVSLPAVAGSAPTVAGASAEISRTGAGFVIALPPGAEVTIRSPDSRTP